MESGLKYFTSAMGKRQGPFTLEELRAQPVEPWTPIWHKGMAQWVAAEDIESVKLAFGWPESLVPLPRPPHLSDQPPPLPAENMGATAGSGRERSRLSGQALKAAYVAGQRVVGNFAQIDLKREVWPLDVNAAKRLAAEPTFWAVSLLAGLPLFFATLSDPNHTLIAFSLFFAAIWALIFCHLVKGEKVAWKWRIGCLLFTGIVGQWLLLLAYRLLPGSYLGAAGSDNAFIRLIGFVGQVGPCEELLKLVPVIAIVAIFRGRLAHSDIVILGVFSGLGFAAFENLSYYQNVISTAQHAVTENVAASVADQISSAGQATYYAMALPLVRSISSTFCHGVWSGIFAHFLSVGWSAGVKRWPLLITGYALVSALHGCYDWLFTIQEVLPAMAAVLSFMLFRVYVTGEEAVPVVRSDDVPANTLTNSPPLSVTAVG